MTGGLGTRLDDLAGDATAHVGLDAPEPRVTPHRAAVTATRPRMRVLAIGSLIALIAVGAAWRSLSASDRAQRVTSTLAVDGAEPDTPALSDLGTDETGDLGTDGTGSTPPGPASTFLLPTQDEWVVVDHFDFKQQSDDGGQIDPAEHGAIWVWRVDGHLVLLQEGIRLNDDNSASPEEAFIASGPNRSTMSWIARRSAGPSSPVGLIGIGIDAEPLREIATRLEHNADGWTLPGASVVVAETAVTMWSDREQANFAPVTPGGTADLGIQIMGTAQTASAGALYQEFFETSGLGASSEIDIAGHSGLLIDGGDLGSWAGVWIDGRVFTWSTLNTNGATVDELHALVGTTEPASATEWAGAIDQRDSVVLEAARATAALDERELPAPLELPRFFLPDGWHLGWVTDEGIWTAEQRAARVALGEALSPSDAPLPVTSRTQAFGLNPDDLIPALTITTTTFGDGLIARSTPGNYTPVVVGDLTGSTYPGSTIVELYSDNVTVWIEAPGLTSGPLLAWLDFLRPRNGDPALGFDVVDQRYPQLFEVTRDDPYDEQERDPVDQWTAAFTDGGGAATAVVLVEMLTLQELRLSLIHQFGPDGDRSLEITGTADDAFINGISPTTAWRYETATGLLTEVSMHESNVPALDMLESLVPIDLETWTALAAPFNADPLNPR